MNEPRSASPPFVDTSVLVRYLTGDPPDMASRAARVIDRDDTLYLTDVAVIETAYVLTRLYGQPRETVVDVLIDLIQRRNVALCGLDKDTVIDALLLCRPSGRISFGDAMIWAATRSLGATLIYSFDSRFPSAGIEVREPS